MLHTSSCSGYKDLCYIADNMGGVSMEWLLKQDTPEILPLLEYVGTKIDMKVLAHADYIREMERKKIR